MENPLKDLSDRASNLINGLQESATQVKTQIGEAIETSLDRAVKHAYDLERKAIIKELMIRHPEMYVEIAKQRANQIISVIHEAD